MMCRLYQMWINRALDDGRKLSARLEQHLVRCERCQDHYERQMAVVRTLSAKAPQRTAEPSAFLRARILNEIKSTPPPETAPRFMRWAWAGGVAAAIALAGIFFQLRTPPPANQIAHHTPAPPPSQASASALLAATSRFTDGSQLLQVATNIDQPLQKEMNLVLADARTVLRSLQTEFVPATLLAKGN